MAARGASGMRPIAEVESELLEKSRTETAKLLQRWRPTANYFKEANRLYTSFYVYKNVAATNPHKWWTDRLAPRRADRDLLRRKAARRNEVILTVAICSGKGHKEQQFDILASQKLYELRDALYFASDWMYDGPTRLSSAAFFIDGIFYVDRRDPRHVDYSKEIIEWVKQTKQPPGFVLRADESKSMDIRFSDLGSIPFGEKCVYIHQGDLEHAVYFTNARLLHSHDDCPFAEAYPMLTFMRRFTKRRCYACLLSYARWVVVDSSRCPHNPSFWCQTCFRHFFQDAEGNYLQPVDYKVFPYLHDET